MTNLNYKILACGLSTPTGGDWEKRYNSKTKRWTRDFNRGFYPANSGRPPMIVMTLQYPNWSFERMLTYRLWGGTENMGWTGFMCQTAGEDRNALGGRLPQTSLWYLLKQNYDIPTPTTAAECITSIVSYLDCAIAQEVANSISSSLRRGT